MRWVGEAVAVRLETMEVVGVGILGGREEMVVVVGDEMVGVWRLMVKMLERGAILGVECMVDAMMVSEDVLG